MIAASLTEASISNFNQTEVFSLRSFSMIHFLTVLLCIGLLFGGQELEPELSESEAELSNPELLKVCHFLFPLADIF